LAATLGLLAGIALSVPTTFIAGGLVAMTLTHLGSWLWLKRRATALGRRVAEADARLCVKCDYPLQQGQTWLQCPECGHETDPNETWRDWHSRLGPFGYRLQLPWLFSTAEASKRNLPLRSLEGFQVVGGSLSAGALLGIALGFMSFATLLLLVIGFLTLVVSTIWWKIKVHRVLSLLRTRRWMVCPRCEVALKETQGGSECNVCTRRWSEAEVVQEWEYRLASWRLRDGPRIPPPCGQEPKERR
jgi:uncharacterized paraquat-inducible protein A